MNSLRNMSISRRLWLILVVAVLMLLALGLLMLKQIHDDLYQAKSLQTRHVVQTASGILTFYHGLETSGVMPREAAQKQALNAVRGLRYNKDEYFWINDLTPVMIMHPANPKLDGQNLSSIRDPDGFAIFNEFVSLAKAKGAGIVNYRWPKPGADTPIEKPRISSCSNRGAGSSAPACMWMTCKPNSTRKCGKPRVSAWASPWSWPSWSR